MGAVLASAPGALTDAHPVRRAQARSGMFALVDEGLQQPGPVAVEALEVLAQRGAPAQQGVQLSKRIGKPGQSSSPNGRKLNEQASRSAELVKKLCRIRTATHRPRIDSYAIVEAFPTTFLGVMIDRPEMLHRPRQRSDRYFAHLANGQHLDQCLAGLLPYRQPALPTRGVGNHDERASLVCALTALYVAAGSFGAVGDCNDGWIILPPRHQFAHWAWEAIYQTAQRDAGVGKLQSVPSP